MGLKGSGLCLDGDGGVRCEGEGRIRMTPRFLVWVGSRIHSDWEQEEKQVLGER